MLVLTRQKDQRIIVEIGGQQMEITVISIQGEKVRLGFHAPTSFKITRKELIERVERENAEASGVKPEDLEGKAGGEGES